MAHASNPSTWGTGPESLKFKDSLRYLQKSKTVRASQKDPISGPNQQQKRVSTLSPFPAFLAQRHRSCEQCECLTREKRPAQEGSNGSPKWQGRDLESRILKQLKNEQESFRCGGRGVKAEQVWPQREHGKVSTVDMDCSEGCRRWKAIESSLWKMNNR